mmetsp:Transcript_9384/g.16800  ORF Transcript_9384/g.16800 Transcript_9384/m.16800 type:complete len:289 (-) Transcript_9384:299-1165(-)
MADLYHLLEELDENETSEKQDPRRLTVDTAATEALSEDGVGEDGEDRGFVGPSPLLALQEARRRQIEQNKHKNDDDTAAAEKPDASDAFLSEQEEELEHVPNELYAKLHGYWLQERNCPELLKYDEQMVQELTAEFEQQQEGIDQLLESGEAHTLLIANLAQQDLDRAKFVLSDWLTQRLNKIETYPLHMREKREYMSEKEWEYLESYGRLFEDHLHKTVLDRIPLAFRNLDEPGMIDKPDYEGYHFWSVKENIFSKEGNELEVGSCVVAKYVDMEENMKQGKVELLI